MLETQIISRILPQLRHVVSCDGDIDPCDPTPFFLPWTISHEISCGKSYVIICNSNIILYYTIYSLLYN